MANGSRAKKATRCRGFFHEKEPITGQDLVAVVVAIVVSPFIIRT
jgi:hypothetical protein